MPASLYHLVTGQLDNFFCKVVDNLKGVSLLMRRFIKSPIALVASCLVWCVFSYLAFPVSWAVAAAAGIILAHVLSQTVPMAWISGTVPAVILPEY